MQVLAIISALAALLLVITSSFVLYEAYMEFSTSESAMSTSSTADHRREREEYNFRVGILAAQVLGSKSFSYELKAAKRYQRIFKSKIDVGVIGCLVTSSFFSLY